MRAGPNWLRHLFLPYREEYNIRRHAPLYCGMYVTFRCNLTCPWCLVPRFPENRAMDDYEATPAAVERLLKHPLFAGVAHVNLTGGEPLLNNSLFDIVRLLRRRGYMTGIVTNGLLLEDRLQEVKDAAIDNIRISIYQNTVDKIATLLPRLRDDIMIATSYIILRTELHNNPEAIEDVVRISHDSECIATRINFYIPTGDCDGTEVVWEDDSALHDLKKRLADRFPKYKIFWRPATKRTVTGAAEKTCRQLWETFHVDALGNLGLCCKLCGTFDAKGGNLFSTEMDDLFNSEYLRGMRAKLISPGPDIPEDCADCLYLSSSRALSKALASPMPQMIGNSLFGDREGRQA